MLPESPTPPDSPTAYELRQVEIYARKQARRFGLSPEDAEDLKQELYIVYLQSRQKCDLSKGTYYIYGRGAMDMRCLRVITRLFERRRVEFPANVVARYDEELDLIENSPDTSAHEAFENVETCRDLDSVLARLTRSGFGGADKTLRARGYSAMRFIEDRFRDGKTLEEVGSEIGVTRERVRQIEVRIKEAIQCVVSR